jgi:hypothetical protein
MNKHAQKQHALTANSDAYARCLMQVAVAVRAATDQRRRPAPESLTVRSKSFAHGAYASTMMGDVCAPLATILRCCVCLLRVPSASDHVCTALRGGQRRRPAPEPRDTKCRGFGDGGTALVTLGDARAPSQSCGAASFYLERRTRPITPSLCDSGLIGLGLGINFNLENKRNQVTEPRSRCAVGGRLPGFIYVPLKNPASRQRGQTVRVGV